MCSHPLIDLARISTKCLFRGQPSRLIWSHLHKQEESIVGYYLIDRMTGFIEAVRMYITQYRSCLVNRKFSSSHDSDSARKTAQVRNGLQTINASTLDRRRKGTIHGRFVQFFQHQIKGVNFDRGLLQVMEFGVRTRLVRIQAIHPRVESLTSRENPDTTLSNQDTIEEVMDTTT